MKKKRILICDDEEGIRESLKLILESDYDLVFVKDANECLEKLKKEKEISLLLLDIKMPKISGLDVLKDVKSLKPGLKVMIISGYKSVETASEAAKLGAVDYILKPFESEEILEKVKKYLE
ncbi:MAG: response regulator [Candidatus Omnitrophota bacterium]